MEVAAIELINLLPTGRTFHAYVNPGIPVPAEATRIHGLTDEFLADKPNFQDIADDLIAFLSNDTIVAHNAGFDLKFLNAELPAPVQNPVICSLRMAREQYPGSKHTLDALCARFGISLARRTVHGALLDCELLAMVFLELMGGRQVGLGLDVRDRGVAGPERRFREPRVFEASAAELARHRAFIAERVKNDVWYQN